MNIFTPASNDQSIYYLGQVFGVMGSMLNGNTTQILGAMFSKINTIALVVGALFLVYITFIGLMHTAQEGEFLGKQWNKLWVPIRTVLGIVCLIPTPTGYSVLQLAMMWIIIQGVGAADSIWNVTLSYAQNVGGLVTPSNMKNNAVDVKSQLQGLFQGLVCQSTTQQSARFAGNMPNPIGYYCADPTKSSLPYCRSANAFPPITPTVQGETYVYKLGPAGYCGSLSYCNAGVVCAKDSASVACASCKAQVQVLAQIVPSLADIAEAFVQTDAQYIQYYLAAASTPGNLPGMFGGGAPPASPPKPPTWLSDWCSDSANASTGCQVGSLFGFLSANGYDPKIGSNNPPGALVKIYWEGSIKPLIKNVDFLKASSDYYGTTIQAATDVMLATQGAPLSSNYKTIGDLGWLYAGTYFYYVAQQNNTNKKMSIPALTFNSPADPSSPNNGNPLYNYRNNWGAAGDLISGASGANAPAALPGVAPLSSIVSTGSDSLFNSFQNTVTGGKNGTTVVNPLASIQSLGESLLLSIEIIFPVVLALTIALGIAGNINVFVLGTGFINPVGPLVTLLEMLLLPLFWGFIALFMAYGGLLAVYTPLIPYIVFTFGAISWYISVVEAMAAAPFIALGIMAPAGQHELLGKAGDHAVMMLFAIFLRPGLMVFGLIAGFILSIAAINIINASFGTAMLQITAYSFSSTGGGSIDILELILFMGVYISLVVTALNKCFAMIHIIPDRVLVWIGAQPGHTDNEALSEAKSATQAAAGGAASGMAGSKSSVDSEAKRQGGIKDKQKAAKKDGIKVGRDDKKS